METGGVSKSLVSLMNVIDRKKYDITLLIVVPCGILMDLLPDDLKIVTNKDMSLLTKGLYGLLPLFKRGKLWLMLGSMLRLFLSSIDKSSAGWLLAKLYPVIDGEYDIIVDYNGQQQLYYMVDKLEARIKVTFFHSDYEKWSYYYRMDRKYYPKVDAIFTISEKCVDSLKRVFPFASQKIRLMENISSLALIEQMSHKMVDFPKTTKYRFLTLGHLCQNKGTDLAILAATILQARDINFCWYFIGNTVESQKFMKLAKELKVEQRVVFLGTTPNPYPYIKAVDLFVHTSLFEGKSIALDEAKLLCKPIVVTNFSTVHDQFEDHVNATIVEMTPESIANGIEELLMNQNLQRTYIQNLKEQQRDNVNEVQKLYSLF